MYKLIYKETKDVGGYDSGGRKYETKKKVKLIKNLPISELQEEIDKVLSTGNREFVDLVPL